DRARRQGIIDRGACAGAQKWPARGSSARCGEQASEHAGGERSTAADRRQTTPMEHFLTVFIPQFVAIDPIRPVPVFLALTQAQDAVQRRRISVQAVAAATVIALGFLFLGRELFDFLQITADDFRIAGGAILLVLAVYDLISYGKPTAHETHMVGLVPLAMPLVAGPALLTTTLVLTSHTGPYNAYAMTTVAVIVNMGLLLMILFSA